LLDDVVNFLNGTGYMTATGSCPTVGVPGWHLGGGYSVFSKLLGLGADNVKSMRVLLPNATEVEASPSSNQDLFWAMRGAGHQSFGWLTSLTIGLLPLETFVYINLETKCAQADIKSCAETIYAWQRFYYENSTVV
jgi:FAD/FMN-containing dehydrogenase